jgi:hypothetical protein
MMWLGLTGQLPAEYRRLGLDPIRPGAGIRAALPE